MKFGIIFCLVIGLCLSSAAAQENLKIEELNNERLIKILNSSELMAENREGYVSVRIFATDNGTASAGFDNCEVSSNLLVGVSGFDEEPEQSLFEIGPFYNPKFISWLNLKEYEKEFVIRYGPMDEPKSLKLYISLKELRIIK